MTLPGFTAEVAASAPASAYGAFLTAGFGGGATAGVMAAAFGGFRLPVFRCCRRAPLFGNRFVCSQRSHLPGEKCTCTATLSGPLITCTENVLTF